MSLFSVHIVEDDQDLREMLQFILSLSTGHKHFLHAGRLQKQSTKINPMSFF